MMMMMMMMVGVGDDNVSLAQTKQSVLAQTCDRTISVEQDSMPLYEGVIKSWLATTC